MSTTISTEYTQNYIVSTPVYYGFNKHTKNFYTFSDSKATEHVVSSFDDAKTILLEMYDNILKSIGKKLNPTQLDTAIKKSPNGSYAYFYLKLC